MTPVIPSGQREGEREPAPPETDQDRRERLLDGIAAAWLLARSYDLLPDESGRRQ